MTGIPAVAGAAVGEGVSAKGFHGLAACTAEKSTAIGRRVIDSVPEPNLQPHAPFE